MVPRTHIIFHDCPTTKNRLHNEIIFPEVGAKSLGPYTAHRREMNRSRRKTTSWSFGETPLLWHLHVAVVTYTNFGSRSDAFRPSKHRRSEENLLVLSFFPFSFPFLPFPFSLYPSFFFIFLYHPPNSFPTPIGVGSSGGDTGSHMSPPHSFPHA